MGLIRNIKAMADVRKRERDVLASKCTIKSATEWRSLETLIKTAE